MGKGGNSRDELEGYGLTRSREKGVTFPSRLVVQFALYA